MLGHTYEGENCSAARALELVGERWSLLIIRDALFGGLTRFGDFQRSLGVASNILANRLERFVGAGLMVRRPLAANPEQHEYLLTDKGRDFQPAIIALTAWGDRWAAPDGAPVVYTHAGCGGPVEQLVRCALCAREVGAGEVVTRPGPAFRPRTPAPAGRARSGPAPA
jgi:DNA-binding HxlR family transcriptional regulator